MNCKICVLALAAAGGLSTIVDSALAQTTAFTYQGQLNAGGAPVSGSYDFRFKLYFDALGNNQAGLASITNGLPVAGGVFSAPVDCGPGVFNGSNYWLEVDVKTNGGLSYVILSPLQEVTPAPYAIFAATASNFAGTVTAQQVTGRLGNSQLLNSAVTVNAGAGLGGGGPVALGGSTVLSNTGVLSVAGNGDISISSVGGAVTVVDNGTEANFQGTLVKRDGAGNFSAGTITATLNGNVNGNATSAGTAAAVTGNIADSQLSPNVARLSGSNTFTGANFFAGPNVLGGVMTATNAGNVIFGAFSGDGSGLSNLAVNVPIPAGGITNNQTGVILSGAFSGNGSGLTNLSAGSLTGSLPSAALPAGLITNGQTGVAFNGTFAGDGSGLTNLALNVPVGGITNNQTGVNLTGTFTGNGGGLNSLNASALIGSVPPGTLISVPSAALNSVPAGSLTGTVPGAALSGTYGNAVSLINPNNVYAGTFLNVPTNFFVTNTSTGASATIDTNANFTTSGHITAQRLGGSGSGTITPNYGNFLTDGWTWSTNAAGGLLYPDTDIGGIAWFTNGATYPGPAFGLLFSNAFSQERSNVPAVVVNYVGPQPPLSYQVNVYSVSQYGFTVQFQAAAGTAPFSAIGVSWVVIGQ